MLLALGEDTLRAIADHDGDRNIDDEVVAGALEQANGLALSYVPQNLVPYIDETNAPLGLRRAIVAVAQHYLRQTRDQSTDDSRAMYADAIRWLEGVAVEKVKLVGIEVPQGVDTYVDPGDPEADGLERIWSRESARGVF